MLFIGAFFLLNLTLAVIQSNYSTTQNRIKEEKAKIKREQEELAMAAQKGASGGDDELGGDDGEGGAVFGNIGVTSFYVAKRAA